MLSRLKSYEQIVAPLENMARELQVLVERNEGVTERNMQTIERLQQHNLQLGEESSKAEGTMAKLRAFLTG